MNAPTRFPIETTRTGIVWTDIVVTELVRLVGEGLSASQIANELPPITRNAVIGKIARMGLKLAGSRGDVQPDPGKMQRKGALPRGALCKDSVGVLETRLRKEAKQPSRREFHFSKLSGRILPNPRKLQKPKGPVMLIDIPQPESRCVTLFELGDATCRWPTGRDEDDAQWLFCGTKIDQNSVYCPYHHRVSVDPSSTRRSFACDGV